MSELSNSMRAAADVLEAREDMPKFKSLGQIFVTGKTVTADVDGNLWQIDADNASMRRVAKM